MTSHLALRRATAVAAVLSCLAVAAPASAEFGSFPDPADAQASLTDIRELRVAHGLQRVTVTVRFTDLRAESDAGPAGLTVFLDANPARRGPELALTTGLHQGTDYQLVRVRRWRLVGEPLTCEHSLRLRPARDFARIRVARTCLRDPARVRVAAQMIDQYDGSHPVVDWYRGPRRFTPWLRSA
ncbi:hypothetical protein [Nocardioides sp. W7]|uniref:hypothetical protein n=1 Tax=Nocardioides sp. W7 TaxID=2931390 RepID=UPI001FD3D330|nr:hypothetical protein [Nocardioides sp. W7]